MLPNRPHKVDSLPVAVPVVITMSSMTVVISVMAPIPVVIVFDVSMVSVPVARIISFAIVPRGNPMSSLVGWTSPIAFMPPVVISYGIPVALHPEVVRPWTCRHNDNDPRRRWRRNCDPNPNGNLGVQCRASGEQHCQKQHRSHKGPHVDQPP